MLLFFILAMLFILHAQFLIRNIVFGTYESTFFQFTQSYLFDRHIATLSLLFTVLCAAAFTVSYRYIYGQRLQPVQLAPVTGNNIDAIMRICLFFGLTQATANFALAYISGFQYQAMAETLESSAFIFELRIIFLLCFSYLSLNVAPRTLWRGHQYRFFRLVVFVYTLSVLVVQSRSRVFELLAVPIFAYLMWSGDKVRWRYIGALLIALTVPNLIVLGRLGMPGSFGALMSGLFSIEYSVILNNILGGAIEHRYVVQEPLTFLKSLWLIIPSPVRTLLGIEVIKSEAYDALVHIADVRNGGYSMLAEMFQNFGWWSFLVFALMGWIIGWLNKRAFYVGHADIFAAMAPLIYTGFILGLRNDFGVFLKFAIQLLLIALFLRVLTPRAALKAVTPASTRSDSKPK
ncbi:hypothetical protein GGR45_003504 [Sphingomonas zeae]|jgi:hypothetical protein|nr:hypothetical protein [Sphingomonas zeae]MBB4049949.1 hypothetical protein [Sphingomonas zeae]